MTFNSIDFLLFFPIFIVLYYLFSIRWRSYVLLAASYYFYACWNPRFLLYLIPITMITYFLAIGMEYVQNRLHTETVLDKAKKGLVLVGILSTMGFLAVLKYTGFFESIVNLFFGMFRISIKIPQMDFVLPVGISYFSFQALGYLIDVYRNKVPVEKNICKYALFISFFPTIMSGPIERAGNLLKQINKFPGFDVNHIRYGLLSFGWGLYLKLVIADNLAGIVTENLTSWEGQPGSHIVFAVILFGIQIYCDFNGYSHMASGVAKMMGFTIIDNFKAPYLAENIKEFWRRWHISLTSWFTEYLYIPLGGNRKGKLRQYVNILIVFGLSGLWHGASMNFVVWGLLNGVYLVIYDFMKHKCNGKQVKNTAGIQVAKRLGTFILVDFAWLFFAMPGFREAIRALKHIVTDFQGYRFFSLTVLNCFPEKQALFIFMISLLLLGIVDWITYNQKDFRTVIFSQPKLIRWTVYLFFMFTILVWGAYGGNHEQTSFIYFDF